MNQSLSGSFLSAYLSLRVIDVPSRLGRPRDARATDEKPPDHCLRQRAFAAFLARSSSRASMSPGRFSVSCLISRGSASLIDQTRLAKC